MNDPPVLTAEEDDALFEALRAIALHMTEWPFERLADGFRQVHASSLPKFVDRPDAARELRRQVTEWLHMSAVSKEAPLTTAQQFLDELVRLGWRGMRKRAPHIAAFARLCLANGTPALALPYLEPLVGEIEHLSYSGRDEDLAMLRPLLARAQADVKP